MEVTRKQGTRLLLGFLFFLISQVNAGYQQQQQYGHGLGHHQNHHQNHGQTGHGLGHSYHHQQQNHGWGWRPSKFGWQP